MWQDSSMVEEMSSTLTTLWDTYKGHTHLLAIALSAAQEHGVLIDKEVRSALVDKFKIKVDETQTQVNALVGREININSPKQIMELLYDEMHLPTVYKKGKPTSDEDALLRLHKRYPDEPVLTLIITYRKDSKLISTFLEAETDEDGRMRTSYNPSGTKNFRISSSKNLWGSGANLQNIPIGRRPGVENIRHIFIAPPGYSFVKGDLVQAETMVVARIMCRYNDYTLWNKYVNVPDFDIHKWAAAPVFGVDEKDVTGYQRAVGKVANHAGNYCAGPGVIQSEARKYAIDGVDYKMAKRIIDTRRAAIPGLEKWWKDVEMQIRRTRTMTTCLGRRRQFFGRFDDNATIRDAVAFEPQSVVGDVCNTIFRRLYVSLPEDAAPVLQVHDEVVVETLDEQIEEVKQEMKKVAIVPLWLNGAEMEPLIIPIDITIGKNWRDCQ